jgi:hypothetical protein
VSGSQKLCGSQCHDNVKGNKIYHIALSFHSPFCIIPFVSRPFLAFILHLVIPSHSHPCNSIFFHSTSAIPSCCHPDVPLLKPDVHDFTMPYDMSVTAPGLFSTHFHSYSHLEGQALLFLMASNLQCLFYLQVNT